MNMNTTNSYIIRPGTNYSPNSEIFLQMNKKKLKEFYQWFMISLPYCIEELMQLIANTPGFESWDADDSPNSLNGLGAWFATKVEKRELTSEEIEIIKSKQTRPVEFASWDLTDETKSLALYVGMYYGEVAVRNNPLVKWEHLLSNRKFADYGQPILSGAGIVPINPVRVAHSIARESITDGKKVGDELRKAYDYWSKLVMPASIK
jgi:hypothetical protein